MVFQSLEMAQVFIVLHPDASLLVVVLRCGTCEDVGLLRVKVGHLRLNGLDGAGGCGAHCSIDFTASHRGLLGLCLAQIVLSLTS